eukprot:PhF_6_TR14094/c1_g1_i2/m.22522/K03236/EIF1A; translation initiation factor 1A
MPKNKGKGGKNRKKGTNKNEGVKRELILREDGQEYGICTASLGCNRVKVHLFSGQDVIGVIRGKIVRRMWIGLGNVVLVGNREFESGAQKVDVILRYSPEEATQLQEQGHIPDISRWSLVGRGGMVEEADDGAGGNIKFRSSGKSTEVKVKNNDGWDLPDFDEEFEEGEEGEEEEDEEEEDEEEEEGELQPDVEIIRKPNRHDTKVHDKRKDDAKTKQAKSKGKGEAPPDEKDVKKAQKVAKAAPAPVQVQPQKQNVSATKQAKSNAFKPKAEGDLDDQDIDDI